mmetsp:Transcript_29589/g.60992  ORF Transcript_29589/g.60992 Transcript_29589/m.60992 type:complete len:212 (+) Transcript_29589:905-1540(+)
MTAAFTSVSLGENVIIIFDAEIHLEERSHVGSLRTRPSHADRFMAPTVIFIETARRRTPRVEGLGSRPGSEGGGAANVGGLQGAGIPKIRRTRSLGVGSRELSTIPTSDRNTRRHVRRRSAVIPPRWALWVFLMMNSNGNGLNRPTERLEDHVLFGCAVVAGFDFTIPCAVDMVVLMVAFTNWRRHSSYGERENSNVTTKNNDKSYDGEFF